MYVILPILLILLGSSLLAEDPPGGTTPASVKLLLGPGLTKGSDDHVDFKEVREGDGNIFIENDSRWRSELMAGVFHEFPLPKGVNTGPVFALEFRAGAQGVLDSVFFGWGVSINKIPHAIFVVGVSRGRGRELSPGFKRAMAEHHGHIHSLEDYDGLSLYRPDPVPKDPNRTVKIFPGDPVIDSYNTKLSIGVLLKIDVMKVFGN